MRRISILTCVAVAALVVGTDAQAQSLVQLGKWCASGEPDRSIAACTDIIEWSHGRPSAKSLAEAYLNRGNAYAERSLIEKAIADFGHAIDLDPARDDAFVGRGMQYFNLQDYKRAVADLDAAIRLNPGEALYWAWRGRAKGQLGDADGANADLVHAHELDPQVENDMPDAE